MLLINQCDDEQCVGKFFKTIEIVKSFIEFHCGSGKSVGNERQNNQKILISRVEFV